MTHTDTQKADINQYISRAHGLIAWCHRMRFDSECGHHWQQQFRAIGETMQGLVSALSAAQARCVEVEVLLNEFMTITTGGVDGGMTEMSSLEGRQEFYERVNAVRKKVLDTSLANGTKEER